MSKKLLLIVGIVVVALGAFFFLKKPAGPLTGTLGGDQTISASLAGLVMMGEDYTCTFETTDEMGTEHHGTVAVADGGTKMDGEFIATQPDGIVTKYNMVRDGEYTYFWSAAEAKGYKMKIDPQDDALWGAGDEADQEGFDENQPVDFTCSPLAMKVGLFTAPTDIEFMDLTAQMEMMQQYTQTMPTQAPEGQQGAGDENGMGQYCGACAQLEGSAQAQCLTAMSCTQ